MFLQTEVRRGKGQCQTRPGYNTSDDELMPAVVESVGGEKIFCIIKSESDNHQTGEIVSVT